MQEGMKPTSTKARRGTKIDDAHSEISYITEKKGFEQRFAQIEWFATEKRRKGKTKGAEKITEKKEHERPGKCLQTIDR